MTTKFEDRNIRRRHLIETIAAIKAFELKPYAEMDKRVAAARIKEALKLVFNFQTSLSAYVLACLDCNGDHCLEAYEPAWKMRLQNLDKAIEASNILTGYAKAYRF